MKNNDINAGATARRKSKNIPNPHNRVLARQRHDDWNKGWSQANAEAYSPGSYMRMPTVRIIADMGYGYYSGRRPLGGW